MGFAASEPQRRKVRYSHCVVCWGTPCDPAHLVPKSLMPDLTGDPNRVIPLCRIHHDGYDQGNIDLLPYLAGFRREVALAVELVGIVATLEIITNRKWGPRGDD